MPRSLPHAPGPRGADATPLARAELRGLVAVVLVVGLTWRLTRYLLRFPVWGDEAMLLVNFPGRSCLDLAGPLERCQVAPLLFLWAESAALHCLGTGELAVRLPALLACLGSLALFARLAREVLPPLARGLAVAVLAVSIWPATLGSLVKPYTFDLFFSLLLLLLAVRWQRRRVAPLGFLAAGPVAVLASYPAVLVAGAVGLTGLPAAWRAGRRTRLLFLLAGAVTLTAFAAHYLIVARAQMASPTQDATTAEDMRDYWRHGFPPADRSLPGWLLLAHTGQMAAYPVGAAGGGSILTVLLCLAGAARLWRRRRRVVVLFACLFALGLLAAAVRGYPYGASCRLAQHLAPVCCLLAGQGLAVLLARVRPTTRRLATRAVFATLALVGIIGLVRDVQIPCRDEESRWAREVVADLLARAGDDPVLVLTPRCDLLPVLRWQLTCAGDRVVWQEDDPLLAGSSLWVFSGDPPTSPTALEAPWRPVGRVSLHSTPTTPREPIRRAHLERWVRGEDHGPTSPGPAP